MNSVITLVFIIFVKNVKYYVCELQNPGDKCVLDPSNTTGVCKLSSNCPTITHYYEINNKFPPICGTEDSNIKICCPEVVREENSVCEEMVIRGSCKVVAKCSGIRDYYLANNAYPPICGMEGTNIKVCCPENITPAPESEESACELDIPHRYGSCKTNCQTIKHYKRQYFRYPLICEIKDENVKVCCPGDDVVAPEDISLNGSDAGDDCILENDTIGICTQMKNVSTIRDYQEQNGKFPSICGISSQHINICNPVENTTIPGDISNKMCIHYSQYVETVEPNPILLVEAEDIHRRDCPFEREELISGGTEAFEKEFPHMVVIGYQKNPIKWECSGSLISDQYVLTAAHCLIHADSLGVARFARMGIIINSIKEEPEHAQTFNVIRRIQHPKYDFPNHDIGLIKLHKKVELGTWVRPACLYTKSKFPNISSVVASGWGITSRNEDEENILRRVTLDLLNLEACNVSTSEGINVMFCAGDSSSECHGHCLDTCPGDSGGPLQIYKDEETNITCMYDIIGIVSSGKSDCGLEPALYPKMYPYLQWIESHVWP